jgi:rhodanese-related sulfurtransferase
MVKNIGGEDIKNILAKEKNSWEIIDVREKYEWDEGHISSARLISMGEIAEREDEIDWSKKVLFYCRSGSRSFQVANYFSQRGKEVWNLEGGVLGLDDDYLEK